MTCQDALRKLFADPKTYLRLDGVYNALDKAYPNKPWARNTIYLHLRFYSVNHPQRKHHPQTEGKCFLFWDGDRGFRKWIPEQDGIWALRDGNLVRLGEDGVVEQSDAVDLLDSEDSTVAGPISLSIERDLEECLVQNLRMLEPGLSLYRDGDLDGRQLDTGAVGIIDVLAMDKDGGFVVIELKAGKAADGACGQILGYISWVQKELAGGKKVRGIIVASDFSDRLQYAVEPFGTISLIQYNIAFNFSHVTATRTGRETG
jgi:Endonuclease NucS C-terminal domain